MTGGSVVLTMRVSRSGSASWGTVGSLAHAVAASTVAIRARAAVVTDGRWPAALMPKRLADCAIAPVSLSTAVAAGLLPGGEAGGGEPRPGGRPVRWGKLSAFSLAEVGIFPTE